MPQRCLQSCLDRMRDCLPPTTPSSQKFQTFAHLGMRPLERLFVAQSTVKCAVFSSPAAQEDGEGVWEEDNNQDKNPAFLNMYYVLGLTAALCVLLLWIIVCYIGMSWLREKDM